MVKDMPKSFELYIALMMINFFIQPRSEEGSLRDCVPQRGLGQRPNVSPLSRLPRQNHVAADRLLDPVFQIRRLHNLKPGLFK